MTSLFLQSLLLGLGVTMAFVAARHAAHRHAVARVRALPSRADLRCVRPLSGERQR